MPYTLITPWFVDWARCPSNLRCVEYHDTEIRGLILIVRPTGRKTFVFRYRDQENVRRQRTIGWFPNIPPELARREAERLERRLRRGFFPGRPDPLRWLDRDQRDRVRRAQLHLADALDAALDQLDLTVTYQ